MALSTIHKSGDKHSTQKLLSALTRIILASIRSEAWILDPFAGSGTTGIAANLLGRRFLGIDLEEDYLRLGVKRKLEIENPAVRTLFAEKLNDFGGGK